MNVQIMEFFKLLVVPLPQVSNYKNLELLMLMVDIVELYPHCYQVHVQLLLLKILLMILLLLILMLLLILLRKKLVLLRKKLVLLTEKLNQLEDFKILILILLLILLRKKLLTEKLILKLNQLPLMLMYMSNQIQELLLLFQLLIS